MAVPAPPRRARAPVAQAYDLLAPQYDAAFQTPLALAEDAVVFAWVRESLEAAFLYDPYTATTLLDVGCGTGLFLEHLHWPALHYTGIDISSGMIDRARAKFPRHRFYVADIQARIAERPRSLAALVALYGTLSYVMDPDRAFAEMEYVLAPGAPALFMFLGPRYPARNSHIVNQTGIPVPLRTWSGPAARSYLRGRGWTDVTVTGISAYGDRIARGRSQAWLTRYLTTESRLLTRWAPDQCFYQCVSARWPGAH